MIPQVSSSTPETSSCVGAAFADVVVAEKLREDAMRAASGCGMIRWVHAVAANLPRFERLLRGVGLRPELRVSLGGDGDGDEDAGGAAAGRAHPDTPGLQTSRDCGKLV